MSCDKKFKVWQTVSCLLLLLLCACDAADSGKPVIAVSFESQKWIVEQLAGDDYEVVALLPQGSDPEMFDPDMRTMRALERADIYLTTSTLGFETQVGERIRANYPDLEVADLTEGIDILMHTHGIAAASDHGAGHGHEHDAEHAHEAHPVGDPHLMSSLRNSAVVARNVLAALTSLRPENEEGYRRNFESLEEKLRVQDLLTDSLLAHCGARGGTFVVMHPSLSYYARDYGMTQIPLEVDGKEATPRELEQRLATALASRPRALFYEEGHSEAQARELARMLGVKAWSVRLNGPDFIEGISEVTKNLTDE